MSAESLPGDNQKSVEINVREKPGGGLDFWAKSLLDQGLITQEQHDEFIEKNNTKEKKMEKMDLPQLNHYGYFNSVEEIREKLASVENQHFIIRCKSKESSDIKRLLDANLDEVCAFAEKLPGGFEKWDVEVKEFVDTIAAGTIIVEPSGRTTIESWPGPHYINPTNVAKYHGEFDPNQMQTHFEWRAPEGAKDLSDYQQYAIQTLRYIFPHLKPRPNEPIYIEYGVKPSGQVYFIEANDSPLVTGGIRY